MARSFRPAVGAAGPSAIPRSGVADASETRQLSASLSYSDIGPTALPNSTRERVGCLVRRARMRVSAVAQRDFRYRGEVATIDGGGRLRPK
jgi:hypothetical protein